MGKEITIPHKFLCRPYQETTWQACLDDKKRIVCCWHRGAGKDLFALNWFIYKMLRKPAVYLHCFPNYSQAKRALWNSNHKTHDGEVVGYLEHFPEEFIKNKNAQEMTITLKNGSIYRIMGLDGKNAQIARGMNPTDVIISEYAYMSSESWDVLEPRVKANDGQVLFLSTPNGKNHFFHLYNYAREHPNEGYFASLVNNEVTGIYDDAFFDDLRNQGKSEDFIQQEYHCSFNRGAQGSYYGKYIEKARDENRICIINIDESLPVSTSWDIGYSDSTAIFIFQKLRNGNINILEYYENHNEGLPHYLQYLDRWKAANNAIWGMHFVPHDMKGGKFNNGNDLVTTARELGYNMQVVPNKSIMEGIDGARSILPNCSFHKDKAKFGILALEFYHKKWNENLKCYYDEPCHDRYSHGCFVAETLVSMDCGQKRIDSVCIGDMVKTPNGLKRVTDLHRYLSSDILRIKTRKGREILCTPNHKIFMKEKLVYADTLCYNDCLLDDSLEGKSLCQSIIGYHGEDTNLGFRDHFLSMKMKPLSISTVESTSGTAHIIEKLNKTITPIQHFIERFGLIIMDQFQKVIISTISTITRKTMTYQTCSVWGQVSMQESAARQTNGLVAKRIEGSVERIARSSRFGMLQKRGDNGIVKMERQPGKKENGLKSFAKYVERKNLPLIPLWLNCVRTTVGLKEGLKVVWTISKKIVNFVRSLLVLTNTERLDTVLEVVQETIEKPIEVFDITVEDDHCYYANGLLVSNSDSFRYLALGVKNFDCNNRKSMTADDTKKMYRDNYGYY